MPSRSIRGFTFLEVLIAVCVVAIALVPALGVFWTSARSAQQTASYQQALFLAEKLVEEVRLGAQEDPYFMDRAILQDTGETQTPIVDRQHPYFARLEDSAPPFGRLDTANDLAIETAAGPLYEWLKSFKVGITTTIPSSTPDGVMQPYSIFDLTWVDSRDHEGLYSIGTPLRVWQVYSGRRLDPPAVEGEDLQLGKALEPGGERPLSRIAAERGADAGKLGALARILYYGQLGESADRELRERLARLARERDAETTPLGRARKSGAIAETEELAAAYLLRILQMMRPAVQALQQGVPPGSLGDPHPPRAQRREAVRRLAVVMESFPRHVSAAIAAYNEVAGTEILPAGWRLRTHRSLLAAWQLAMATYAVPEPDKLRVFCEELAAYYADRHPHVEHNFTVEGQRVGNLGSNYLLSEAARDFHLIEDNQLGAGVQVMLATRSAEDDAGLTPDRPGSGRGPNAPPGDNAGIAAADATEDPIQESFRNQIGWQRSPPASAPVPPPADAGADGTLPDAPPSPDGALEAPASGDARGGQG